MLEPPSEYEAFIERFVIYSFVTPDNKEVMLSGRGGPAHHDDIVEDDADFQIHFASSRMPTSAFELLDQWMGDEEVLSLYVLSDNRFLLTTLDGKEQLVLA